MGNTKNVIKWVIRSIPVIMSAYLAYIIVTLVRKHSLVLGTNLNAPEPERVFRQQFRGILVSLSTSITAFVAVLFMRNAGVPVDFIETNFSFFYSNVITYIMERIFATDEGLRLFKQHPLQSAPRSMKSLTEIHFIKFFLTVMLDMFISIPIIEVLSKYLAKYIPVFSTSKFSYDQYIAKGIRPLLFVFVAAITFLAYSNMTRFQWAYPSENPHDTQRINDSQMYLAISVAAALYATYYLTMSSDKGSNIGVGVFYVVLTVCMMALLSSVEKEDETSKIVKAQRKRLDHNVIVGTVLFIIITFIGIVIPLLQISKNKK